ncbi:MAG: hypothetical protein IJK93_09525 [Muribaculaceae bacterium]|nr:hypothetical protein [Muribaculaceae bacterium]
MDFNSPEFFTLAFVVAMALVALLMGKREHAMPSTQIVQLATTLDEEGEAGDDILTMEPADGGGVLIRRSGLTLAPDETVNLVFTIGDETCTIVEKKGVRKRAAATLNVKGEVRVKFLKPKKYRIRYESQVTSAWATFTFDTSSPQPLTVSLKY